MCKKTDHTGPEDFNLIFNRYWHELYTYAMNIMRDNNAAEDIVQEIFIDLWNRYRTTSITNHKAYLYKAVKYQCAKKLRARRLDKIQLEKAGLALAYSETPEEEKNTHRLLAQVNTVVAEKLPDRCREVFTLSYYNNMSNKEIAHQLNISVSTVENHIHKALQLLRASTTYRLDIILLVLSLLC
ncbi:RNA polymerase sigma factor [Sinomicrobium weinanense]|uniref:RNA polymerase sigma-70 factor n=1 Tax=Sinomicrobium weinanense TaxID=2842200 RepID=A0A926JP54_9FLAO|nr:RNA polymerase sigma-70 factor [Sinomicrobium weinanense]MBC9794712.1 RNA polymerase sigma-70 factor [Sinomicrobium weinanense]MBU3124971.1 RNA polymerase sigma-70 factor [Sinomicrobium weinanense]